MAIFKLIFVLLFVCHAQSVTDTLLQGQVLTASDYLISADATFRLGFFSLGDVPSWYIGIAYNTPAVADSNAQYGRIIRSSQGTYHTHKGHGDKSCFPDYPYDVVWVANRDIPFSNGSVLLTIDEYGVLKMLCHGISPVVLSSFWGKGNVSATLLGTGNLVLKEENGGRVLWQSFDYPTNTLLPEMKIGINFKTGQKWSITSWTNSGLPASGSYSLGLDPNGSAQLMIWWQGKIIWSSGLWNKDHFEQVPNLSNRDSQSFKFVSTKNERYFTYSSNKKYTFPRYQISYDGRVYEKKRVAPLGACPDFVTYVHKTEYDYPIQNRIEIDPGCVDVIGKLDDCMIYNYSIYNRRGFIFGYGFKYTGRNLSDYDCLELCIKNCSCVAYSYINDDQTGCEIWNEDMQFIAAEGQQYRTARDVSFLNKIPRYVQPEYPIPINDADAGAGKLWRWISIVTSLVLLVPVFCFALFWMGKRLKVHVMGMVVLRTLGNLITLWSVNVYHGTKSYIEYANSSRQPGQESLLNEFVDVRRRARRRNTGAQNSHVLQFFKVSSMVTATDNFSPANKLGEGGFGSVYKGKLQDGLEVAIKRLAVNSVQGIPEFKNELLLIAKLQHTNLVRLVGCCINQEEKMLIYEYMPNKSLDFFLFDSSRKYVLDWRKRFNIAEGISQGLLYLHKYSRLRIIHRDLKAGNILLDQDMNPKISDFGMAKIFGNQQSRANTNRVAGTFGYMPPEYAMEGLCSMKSDVYSFGVILLEIVSGRMSTSFYTPDHPLSLTGYTWELCKEGRGIEVIDNALTEDGEESYNQNEANRCIQVGLLCVQENPDDRPTMADVVAMISYDTIPLPSPKQPAFYVSRVSSSYPSHREFHSQAEFIQTPDRVKNPPMSAPTLLQRTASP